MDGKGKGETIAEIAAVPHTEVPLNLLLEADPSPERVREYLPRSKCLVATVRGETVGACAVLPTAPGTYELMSIAVSPGHQGRGIGSRLLRHTVAMVREAGARRLEVGTGTFGYQLAFYQRAGFRVFAVERDFFLSSYDEPIHENGIQHKDMLRLAVEY